MTQKASQQNSETPKRNCNYCKKPAHYPNQSRKFKREKDPIQITRIVPTILTIIMVLLKRTLTLTITSETIPTRTRQIVKETKDLYLSSHLVRPVVELTTPQNNVTLEQTQPTDRLPGKDDRKDKTKSNRETLKATQTGMPKLQPKQ